MYQAGVKYITLYENVGITFKKWDAENLQAITDLDSAGQIILIENYQHPEYEIKIELSKSGYLVNNYKIAFYLLGLTLENYNIIEQITSSIYGWCFLIEYYDGTKKYYNSPIYLTDTEIKPHDEMSFELKMESKVPSREQYYEYTPDVSSVPVYRSDTTILRADTTIYTADYGL